MTKYLRCVNKVEPMLRLKVGMRYEVVDETDSRYNIGEFGTFTKQPDSDGRSFRTWFVLETEGDEYMEIDGVKYREVSRKATVGDFIMFDRNRNGITKGKPYAVTSYFGDVTFYDNDGDKRWSSHIAAKYAVLEPITDIAASDVDLIVLQRELNVLRRKQSELTTQVDELIAKNADIDVQIDGLTDAFAKLVVKTNSPAKTVLPQDKPSTRDEIVAQARRDVAELSTTAINIDVIPTLDGDVEAFFPGETDYVDFVVNRDKRTVVALIRYIGENDVWAKGIAKAAPGDVFNSHIGRAIALRRALGLAVPTEYTNAPQPTEPRVGDVVVNRNTPQYQTVVTGFYDNGDVRVDIYTDDDDDDVVGYEREAVVIIDDSREGSEVSA